MYPSTVCSVSDKFCSLYPSSPSSLPKHTHTYTQPHTQKTQCVLFPPKVWTFSFDNNSVLFFSSNNPLGGFKKNHQQRNTLNFLNTLLLISYPDSWCNNTFQNPHLNMHFYESTECVEKVDLTIFRKIKYTRDQEGSERIHSKTNVCKTLAISPTNVWEKGSFGSGCQKIIGWWWGRVCNINLNCGKIAHLNLDLISFNQGHQHYQTIIFQSPHM